MFGPKLRRADQPFWMRFALGLFEWAASLEVAVVLILTCAASLAWATFVESAYGTPAVQFGVYGTWWFAGINLLLAINIFCAAAIRYPWKRHQTGFVVTHIGLLTLLFGCLVSRRGGIDAQMPIFEDQVGNRAFEDANHFQLAIERKDSGAATPTIVNVPFTAGPFNWEDYSGRLSQPINSVENEGPLMQWFLRRFATLNGWVFRLAHRDQGTLYNQDGVQVEVLDYYADSEVVPVPLVNLKMRMTTPTADKMNDDGKFVPGPEQWVPLELSVENKQSPTYPLGMGGRQMVGGGSLTLLRAGSADQVEAFLHSAPEGEVKDKGQVVLYAGGATVHANVDEKLGKGRFPLGDTGIEAEIADQVDNPNPNAANKDPMVSVRLYRDGKSIGRVIMLADRPELNMQDYDHNVYGTYWFNHQVKDSAARQRGASRSRIDILEAPAAENGSPKLYYRYWNGKELVFAQPLPTDGTPMNAFKMPIAQLKLAVDEVIARDLPEGEILSLPFDAKKERKIPAARLRITLDGKPSEFWLRAIPGLPDYDTLAPSEKHTVKGGDRIATVTMPPDEIDIGFGVRLKDFERKLDPGTRQPSHYSSVVDFVDLNGDKTMQKDVLITMNAPVDFSDPKTDRSYRLFQESFFGPIRPGSAEFDKYFAGAGRDEGYISFLTVNYDPGRAIKYTGCLLIVGGIATMFYMRAYFFKPTVKQVTAANPKPKHKREPVATH